MLMSSAALLYACRSDWYLMHVRARTAFFDEIEKKIEKKRKERKAEIKPRPHCLAN